MWTLRLAWKNLWRNRMRTAVTLSAIFFGVLLSSLTGSLQDGIFSHFIRNMVGYYHGYLQIHSSGYWEEPVIDNSFHEDPATTQLTRNHPGIKAMSPRLESFALVASGEITKGCLVVGIDPDMEKQIITLDRRVYYGQYPEAGMEPFGLISEGLASRMSIRVRDTLLLLGQGYHGTMAAGKIPVTGVLRFGAPELNNNLLFISIAQARSIFGADERSTSWVLLPQVNMSPEIIRSELKQLLGGNYEVMTWREMLPEVDQHIRIDRGSLWIISFIIYLLVAAGILGTLLMMVAERTREFGILISIGMHKGTLMGILLTESMLQVLLGTTAGVMTAYPVAWLLNVHPIRPGKDLSEMFTRFGFEPVFPASVDPAIFLRQGSMMVLLIALVSMIPVIKVRSLDPVSAIKK